MSEVEPRLRTGFTVGAPDRPATTVAPPTGRTVDLGPLRRLGAAMLGVGLLRPLLPGPSGVACPLRSLTGVPCPLCGMTTSVTEAVHLRLPEAVAANPGGVLLVLAAMVLLVVRRPRSVVVPPWAPAAVVVLVAAAWADQLWWLSGA